MDEAAQREDGEEMGVGCGHAACMFAYMQPLAVHKIITDFANSMSLIYFSAFFCINPGLLVII